ncbi:MAG TPA: metal-sensitive transcriptional regulator [Candidatus Hydrogenedentes bacterium]|nr:metal-sensitive transcriptional regulator [Candidatus Hydrogenedentota bacterium]
MREETTDDTNKLILDRIHRIEGQVKGIRRMIEERRGCYEVVKQTAATAGALRSLGVVIMERHLNECIDRAISGELSREQLVGQLLDVFNRVSA